MNIPLEKKKKKLQREGIKPPRQKFGKEEMGPFPQRLTKEPICQHYRP